VLAGVVAPGQLIAFVPATDNPPASVPPADSAPADTAASTPVAGSGEPGAQPARVTRDEAFGDWRFVCVEVKDGAAPSCSASQQLRVAETGNAVFIWRIAQDGRGGLVGIWRVPETVLLAGGLTLEAGTPQPIVIPFESCGGGGCQAVANLAPDFLAKLSAARTLSASVVLTNRQPLKFPLSATGLADALTALTK
jgi:invasion protein IalB